MGAYFGRLENPQAQMNAQIGQTLGQGLGSFMNHYQANKALQSIINSPHYKKAPVSERLQQLNSKLSAFGETGAAILGAQLGIEEQQMNERESSALAKAYKNIQLSPEEEASIRPQNMQKLQQQKFNNESGNLWEQSLIKQGADPEFAKNFGNKWRASEPGVQTELVKQLNDQINRGLVPGINSAGQGTGEEKSGKFSSVNPDFEYPQAPPLEGANLKEQAARKSLNAQENIKSFNANKELKRGAQLQGMLIGRLQQLSPKIETGFSKVFINPVSGELILPAGASPEAQEYAKVIQQMLSGAKDTFGSRVTNFDAQQFLNSLPKLANSPEGRANILRQMEIINRMNKLYYDSLDDVYKKYPQGAIDPIQAEDFAERAIASQLEALKEEWNNLDATNEAISLQQQQPQSFDQRPPAEQYSGQVVTSPEGQRFRSNGKVWVPIQ